MSIDSSNWPSDVLNFWFEELSEKDWFKSSAALDATIVERFESIHRTVRDHRVLPEPCTADTALASVIVLDQFSRHMFRGTGEAFSYDSLALAFTKQALKHKMQDQLSEDQQQFLFMPLMHSENIDDQIAGADLFTGKSHKSAIEHRNIIRQFSRFPHRNAVLGRNSTAEELAYLKNGKRFGQ